MKLFYLILSALLFTANAQDSSTGATTGTPPPPTTLSTVEAATTQSTAAPPPPTTGPPTAGSPTTVPPATGSSTAAPPNTASTPTASPEPNPFKTNSNLTTEHYSINGTDDNYCIMIAVAMQFNLTYIMNDNKLNYAIFNLENANATGVCDSSSKDQIANLVFGDSKEFTLTLTFSEYSKDSDYGLNHMTFTYTLGNNTMFPDAKNTTAVRYLQTIRLDEKSSSDYRIDMGGSYKCNNEFPIHFYYESTNGVNYTESNPTLLVTSVDNFQYQAFTEKDTIKFGTYTECSTDFGTSDIVPIAVGCALAALVVIVLIAYLIGRRRSRQKGYQSV